MNSDPTKLRVHTTRPLTDTERAVLLALAQLLPMGTFHAAFTMGAQ